MKIVIYKKIYFKIKENIEKLQKNCKFITCIDKKPKPVTK